MVQLVQISAEGLLHQDCDTFAEGKTPFVSLETLVFGPCRWDCSFISNCCHRRGCAKKNMLQLLLPGSLFSLMAHGSADVVLRFLTVMADLVMLL